MLFHQAIVQFGERGANSPAAVFTVSLSPPTLPICTAGTPINFARSTTFTASSGLQVMTTRDCVSPNSKASRRLWPGILPSRLSAFSVGDRQADACPTTDKSIVAPINRGVSRATSWLMQLSARQTARPPSLQSCALFTSPD